MRKLALSDEILLEIEKPARYIGNEINSVMKNRNEVDIRFAMCFPDVYEIGMSHLGIQILYDMFNRREDTWCERVYSPWPDLDAIMRKENIPLFALESQDNIKDFDYLGITKRDFEFKKIRNMRAGQDAIVFKLYVTPSETQPVIQADDGVEAKKIQNIYVYCQHLTRIK